MKPTHSTGTSFEGYELCPFCVPSYVVDSTAMGCKSCCCSNGKVATKSNEESEVKYSPPPGVGLSFTCCHPPLSHQTDGFQMLVDSGSSKYFVDPKLVHGVESTMEIKAAGHNTLFGIAQGTLLVEVRGTQDIFRTVKLPIVLVPGLGRIFFSTAMAAQKGVKTVITKAGSIVDLGLFSIQLTRSDNLDFILSWLFQKKVNGQSRHLALFRENHSVRKVH